MPRMPLRLPVPRPLAALLVAACCTPCAAGSADVATAGATAGATAASAPAQAASAPAQAAAAPLPASAAPPPPPARAGAAPSAPASAASAPDDATRQAFAAWVGGFRDAARTAGIHDPTLHAALDDVHFLPSVIEHDRAQPEFTRTVWDYLDSAVSPARVARGTARLAEVRRDADAAAAKYGVPAPVLAAIWGVESNFGGDFGDVPAIDALATLAFEGRREAWARSELLDALRILQSGDIDRAHLVGSWAGALGQTQFLPSVFLAHAVDADGDGRRDIWGSMADVLASTGHFMQHNGWRAGEPWGVEVKLPAGFDPIRADSTLRLPSAQWTAEGVRTVDGQALPAMSDAAILLPAGVRGPAFLVGANFRAILKYNNATSYALAVGLLSQRLAGGSDVQAAWPRDLVALTRAQVQQLQAALKARGLDVGTPDGVMGPATRAAYRQWQRGAGLPADGYPTVDGLQQLESTPAPPAAAH